MLEITKFEWASSEKGKPLLVISEEEWGGQPTKREFIYAGKYTSKGPVPSVAKYYVCLACRSKKEAEQLKDVGLPRLKLEETGQLYLMDQSVAHLCQAANPHKVVAKHFERKRRLQIQTGSERRPKEVYHNMQSDLVQEFAQLPRSDRLQIEKNVPTYRSVRSSYYRKINGRYPTLRGVGDPPAAWDELMKTWEARATPDVDDTLLLYQETQPPMVVLASKLDIQMLHRSHHWVCDGTFEYCPPSFCQLYTIHGFVHGEAVPLVAALLPSKTATTYDKLFQAVRDALTRSCGSVGALQVAHFDFEAAAILSCQQTLPGVTAKGCLFHFVQCLTRKIGELGLQTLYRDPNSPEFKEWVRKLVGLSLLPTDLVVPHWNMQLKASRPSTGDARLDSAIQEFLLYFERQWLHSPSQVELWNYYSDTDNLRTSNHAEGWHSSLKQKFKSQPRMPLGKFLAEYQRYIHHQNQVRIRQLQRGELPNGRRPIYVRNNEAIERLKREINGHWHEFLTVPLVPPFQTRSAQFAFRIDEFLKAAGRRLGLNA